MKDRKNDGVPNDFLEVAHHLNKERDDNAYHNSRVTKSVWNAAYRKVTDEKDYKESYEKALSFIKNGQTVIDVGGGSSKYHSKLKKAVGDKGMVVNLDVSDVALKRSRDGPPKSLIKRLLANFGKSKGSANATAHQDGIYRVQAWLPESPIKGGIADHVFCLSTVDHMKPEAVLSMLDMVKPGGSVHFDVKSAFAQDLAEIKRAKRWDENTTKYNLKDLNVSDYSIHPFMKVRHISPTLKSLSSGELKVIKRAAKSGSVEMKVLHDVANQPLKYWVTIRKPGKPTGMHSKKNRKMRR